MEEPSNISRLRGFAPDANITVLQGGGANIITPKGIVTVWLKKRKYGLNGKWEHFRTIRDFSDIINQLINPEPKVAHIERKVPEKTTEELLERVEETPWQLVSNNRVQDCIDHILKKREFIMQNQPDNKLATFCMTLADELKSYL